MKRISITLNDSLLEKIELIRKYEEKYYPYLKPIPTSDIIKKCIFSAAETIEQIDS